MLWGMTFQFRHEENGDHGTDNVVHCFWTGMEAFPAWQLRGT